MHMRVLLLPLSLYNTDISFNNNNTCNNNTCNNQSHPLMSMPDRLSRPRIRCPAESVSVSFLCLFQPVCVSLSSVLATIFLPFVRGSRRVRRMRRGANTFPSHNRLPNPFSLVARPCSFLGLLRAFPFPLLG